MDNLMRRFAFAASLLQTSVCLGITHTVGDFNYDYNLSSKTATLTGYTGSSTHITIPSSFKVTETYKDEDDGETHTRHHTITVSAIGSSAFANKAFINGVTFHNKVTTIGASAFEGCTGLLTVSTPSSLASLGSCAFQNCSSLEEAEVNGSALDMSGTCSLFVGCSSLRRIVFGDGVVALPTRRTGWYVSPYLGPFEGCTSLEEVVVGAGVTQVPDAFLASPERSRQPKPGQVSFKGVISRIGGDNSLALTSLTNLEIRLAVGCMVGASALRDCPGVSERSLAFANIAAVGASAFHGCTNICGEIDLGGLTVLSSSAFQNCTGITSVKFAENLTTIGSSAFEGCTGLLTVSTPSSLASLGSCAFQNCSSLEEAEINGTGLDLYESSYLFFGCSKLKRVVFGDGVTRLYKWSTLDWRSGTFNGCGNLQLVSVGCGVTEIPPYFLAKCGNSTDKMTVSFAAPINRVNSTALGNSNIEKLYISLSSCIVEGGAFASCPAVNFGNIDFSKIVSIDYSAFKGCVNLRGALDLASVNSVGSSAFQGCTGLTSIKFADGMKTIGESAFHGCTRITRINTPESLSFLGGSAFRNCTGLEEAVINGTGLDLYESSYLFFGCSKLKRVVFGDGVTRLYKWSTLDWRSGTFNGCGNLQLVSIGCGVTEIPPYFLAKCGNSTDKMTVSFAAPISKICSNALGNANIADLHINFSNCHLESKALADCPAVSFDTIDFSQITYIGNSAFKGCVNLSGDLHLLNSPKIEGGAFANCTALTSVEIAGTADGTIYDETFSCCTALKTCELGNGVSAFRFDDRNIGGYQRYSPFYGCSSLESVKADSVDVAPGHLFENLTALKNVSMSALTEIKDYAFGNCQSLGSISSLANVAYLGSYAFSGCSSLSGEINLQGLSSISSYAFTGCRGITSVKFSESLASLEAYAFASCSELARAEFGERLASIGNSAFQGCASLASVIFSGAPPTTYDSTFSGVKSGAEGRYTARHANDWTSAIDGSGYWHGLKMKTAAKANVAVNFTKENTEFDTSCGTAYWLCPLGDDGYTPLPILNGETWEMPVGTHTLNLYSGDTAFADPKPITVTIDGTQDRVTVNAVVKRKTVHFKCIFHNTAQKDYGMLPASLGLGGYCRWNIGGDWYNSGQGIDIPTGDYTLELEIDPCIRLMASTDSLYVPISLDGTDDNPVYYVNALGDGGAKVTFDFKGHSTNVDAPPAFDLSKASVTLQNSAGDEMTVAPGEYCLPKGAYTASFGYRGENGTSLWIAPDDIGFVINGADKAYTLNFIDADDAWFFVRVLFDANGGTVDAESVKYAVRGQRTPMNTCPVPARDNAEFLGWYTKKNGGRLVCSPDYSGFVPTAEDKAVELVGQDGVSAGNYAIRLYAHWKGVNSESRLKIWLEDKVPALFATSGGDVAAASVMTAANGTRTLGECYDLGIDPEDPDDDFRITHFEMKDGRPVITVNHTADGAGESFESRIRTLGKKALGDADWDDVTNGDATDYRFFTVTVDAK